MISGILLAAGESKRMGGAFKPLMKWGKTTVIAACIKNLRQTRLDEIIVVLGHRESEVRARLAGSGVIYAINPDYKKGMISSIKTGIAAASPGTDAFLIALVDQPMVTSGIINRLVIIHGDNPESRITVPVYQGKHGHPIIISKGYEPAIMALDDDAPEGLRSFIDSHRDEITEVEVGSSVILEDIDTPEDYERYARPVEPVYEYHKWHP
ncbi:MAG TPA: nucleotidyltransferase family protein [Blastocatellia bacterium]|nr:nucleotidyltransferase family protein [Blastocatellia bacterium]